MGQRARMFRMSAAYAGLVVWGVDGTLIPADLRWLRRAVARTYGLREESVVFPKARVHGYTDQSIVVDTAVASGVRSEVAEEGVSRFPEVLAHVMSEGEQELARDQPAYPGALDCITALREQGFAQTVLTGNLRVAAEVKLRASGLDRNLDLDVGAFGDDARDRFELPAVVAERFAARYGTPLEPSRAVVIGDAPNDIACARHAGFHVIAVAHRVPRKDLEQHAPDAALDRLDTNTVVSAVTSLTGN